MFIETISELIEDMLRRYDIETPDDFKYDLKEIISEASEQLEIALEQRIKEEVAYVVNVAFDSLIFDIVDCIVKHLIQGGDCKKSELLASFIEYAQNETSIEGVIDISYVVAMAAHLVAAQKAGFKNEAQRMQGLLQKLSA